MRKTFMAGVAGGVLVMAMVRLAGAETYDLSAKWNLLSSTIDLPVANVFASSGNFSSVWKWADDGKGGKTWALYLPSADGGLAYAQSKGFVPLTLISAGEGFWVNSKSDTQVTVSGNPVYGPLTFSSGWNLLGIKGTQPLAAADFGVGESLWKWTTVNNVKTWAVYLANETDKGAAYAAAHGYGLLTAIAPGEGFWVNVSATSGSTTTTTTSTTTSSTTTTTTTLPSSSLANTAWFIGKPSPAYPRDANTLVFLDTSRYLFAKSTDGSADPNCTINGIEYGTYSWDPSNSSLTTAANDKTAGFDCGFDGLTQATFAVNGNTATLTVPGEGVQEGINQIAGTTNPLVGTWGGINPSTQEGFVIVFLDGSNFMFIQKEAADACGHTGMEHGTYTWNPTTKLFTTNVPIDTNGCWGFSDGGGISASDGVTIVVTGDEMQLTFPGDGVYTTSRL